MRHIAIIGGTSTIAQECAKLWIKEGPKKITLVVRDQAKATVIADDLLVRSPKSIIKIVKSDFIEPIEINKTICDITKNGQIDIALIAHGSLPKQLDCQSDITLCKREIEINAISPALFAEKLAMKMLRQNQGTIAIISSVAGDRGRKSNYIYGSAKSLLSRYAEGLQHRLANSPIKVILIKPGPTATPMTASLINTKMKLTSPSVIAKSIVKGVEQGKSVIYTPAKWRPIMLLIQHIPSFIFYKMNL